MLTKIKLENFMSFRNETIIDVTATNYKMLLDTNVYNNILKGLLFVGPNASGKTNAINSIRFLLKMLFSNEEVEIMNYFCFFRSSDLMSLEFTFKFDDDEIVYGFIIKIDMEIMDEYLKLNNEIKLQRKGTSAKSYITDKKIYNKDDIDKNTLFLRNIYFNTKFKGFFALEKWFNFLINSVYINSVYSVTEATCHSNNNLLIRAYLEKSGTEKINNFFSHFGFNQKISYDNEHMVSDNLKLKILKNQKEIFLKRNDMDLWIPFENESLGNKTLLNMLPAFLHTIENNSMLLIDEFSSALHNDLEELLIRHFMYNSKQSQVFFVSHSTNLLSTTLLRPDQIYSTNFKDKNGTYLKRFSSESPRVSQNLEKMYISGKFDGLPGYKEN